MNSVNITKVDLVKLSMSNAPGIKVTPPGHKSKELLDYQASHESSAVTYAKGMPMAIRRAKGATIEDVDGNVYIDCFGGAGVISVGHANPIVLHAAHNQIDQVTHALDIPSPARKALEEVIFQILPDQLSGAFFGGPTGSDAVEQRL